MFEMLCPNTKDHDNESGDQVVRESADPRDYSHNADPRLRKACIFSSFFSFFLLLDPVVSPL